MTIPTNHQSHSPTVDRLIEAACRFFGPSGRSFLGHVAHALLTDSEEFVAFVKDRQEQYRQAVAHLRAPGRNLPLEHDKFTMIYSLYSAAIRFKICPLTEAELLEVIMTCERDHINLPPR